MVRQKIFGLPILVLLFVTVSFGYAAFHEDHHWVRKEISSGDFPLSENEKQGVYNCSIESPVREIRYDAGTGTFMVIAEKATLIFLEKELSADLRDELFYLQNELVYERYLIPFHDPDDQSPPKQPFVIRVYATVKILCVHPAFRGNWQGVYDRDGVVYPLLLLFEPIYE
ncbi:MAG: hypothetical protein HYW89_01550 [Candidatus Sungiibacteriota bacterium]|uniref:Uncharacterized protein n=1 Tax=Candidatus Sungiibacteriota bacterium TaxID=2750080 RepID=A0A7T5URI7_9BACT|nr:MAG: hypothetical protein HYW89_01550 [Candidatus Sungbacteria bacterium]